VIRRIALMRAQDDAEATAAELAARGYEAVIAPAIEIRVLPAAPPEGRFDGLVAASPRAFHALSEADRARLATIPLHVVGARAARAAREAGLALAGEPAADAGALADRLARTLPAGARLLYLAGRDRKPTLEAALATAGLAVQAVELYAAEARAAWSAREARAVAGCDGALHYSRRTAALAVALAARAGLAEPFGALLHVCLSADVAEPLAGDGAARIVRADAPDEAHVMAALERALGPSSKG
jgi:uroporphyrinogen-III synthase